MFNEENKIKIIEQYLAGTLNPKDAKAVEERLQTDEAFRHEFALQERIIRTIQEGEREFLHHEIDHMLDETIGWHYEKDEVKVPIVPLARKHVNYAGIAITVLLIAAGILFWWNGKQSAPEMRYLPVVPDSENIQLPADISDSIPVVIIDDKMLYDFHYQFDDTLKLYGYFHQKEMLLNYSPDKQAYTLKISNQSYPIAVTEKITSLQPVN